MTDTTLRYLAMLETIPQYPESVANEHISQVLGRQGLSIHPRSIQRDLQKLATPFHLMCEQEGKKLLWSYDPDARPRMFPAMDEHTALSFQLVENFLRPLLPPETLDALEPWMKMAAERLSSRKGYTAKWQEKIHILPPGIRRTPPRIDPDVQAEVYQAVLHEYPIQISYVARSRLERNQTRDHAVSPLGLVVRDHLLYLVAAMPQDGKVLYFALHRIKDARPAETEYQRPKGFNLRTYADEAFGFPMGTERILALTLRLTKNAAIGVAECPLAATQNLTAEGEGFVLKANVANTLELRQWIRSLGTGAEVMSPRLLRNELAAEFATLAQRYGG